MVSSSETDSNSGDERKDGESSSNSGDERNDGESSSNSGDERHDGEISFGVDPSYADAVIAKNLNAMSLEERNFVLEDIHGVRGLRIEEQLSSRMTESLEHMSNALDNIEGKPAFDEAALMNSHYVLQDKKFRIQFLRADEFNAKKAAQRLVNYLEFYRELFGTVALMRPICFDDLNKEEQRALRDGPIQILPCRDRSGRRILFRTKATAGCPEFTDSFNRVVMYMQQVLGSDETTQKLGCVVIFHACIGVADFDIFKTPSNFKANIRKRISALPVRLSAIHVCCPNTRNYRLTAAAFSLIVRRAQRVRIRFHFGPDTECRYSLETHGISGNQIPITATGRIKTTNHQRWIRYQRFRDITMKIDLVPFEGVDCPELMDVLLGNAGCIYIKNNPGNITYNEVTDQYFNKYDAAEKHEKMRIICMVLDALGKACGQILIWDSRGWWSVASTGKVREKIAVDFRRKRLAVSKQQQLSLLQQQLKRPSDPVEVNASTNAFLGLDGVENKKRCLDNQSVDRSDNDNSECSFDLGCMRAPLREGTEMPKD